mmetsp:Transcript_9221/g.23358  ORF Transcript_9221/g.23358 Transcript_9221/m.23358 type:complete len:511 (-) Transcript_9221:168-1700(-)
MRTVGGRPPVAARDTAAAKCPATLSRPAQRRPGASSSHGAAPTELAAARPSCRGFVAALRTAVPVRGVTRAMASDKAGASKEEHKIFDEVVITVRSGKGGTGEITQSGKGKWVPNHKYRPGGNMPKQIWVTSGTPADGCDGGSVILRADPMVDALTHLHSRSVYAATKGANGNPAMGSSGPKSAKTRSKYFKRTEPLVINVPPGTEVRKKRGNWLIGELLKPGDSLTVVRGGKGGIGVVAPSRQQKIDRSARAKAHAVEEGYEEEIVEDVNWREDSNGQDGEELTVRLLLRVVADVGIVGLPNAGKSSLLAAMTKAKPEVAPYPFTTLMPNLGVLQSGGNSPVLADLPGLIEGAHEGRGLGFMFLRHLRRTRMLMHVIDASDQDPVTDYFTVREELRMYNPQYTSRPHVVVLNKMDMEDAYELQQELQVGIMAVSARLKEDHDGVPSVPSSIILTSAVDGTGVEELNAALNEVLGLKAVRPGAAGAIDAELLRALKESGIDVNEADFLDV